MKRFSLLSLLLVGFALMGQTCISIGSRTPPDGGVFRSDTSGTSWAQVVFAGKTEKARDILLRTEPVRSLVIDPHDANRLYWGTIGKGILRTNDSGGQWVTTGVRSGTYTAIALDPQTADILYAATGGDIAKSTDGGATWEKLYTETRPGQIIADVVVDFFNPTTILAVTGDGVVIRSTDYGATWALHAELKMTTQHLLMNPKDSRILYATSIGRAPMVSRDGGVVWTDLTKAMEPLNGANAVNQVAFFPGDPSRIFAATNRGLISSRDGGDTWEDVPTLIPQGTLPIQYVVIHPTDPNTIYFIARNKLHVTINAGLEWTVYTLPTSRPITTFLLNPENPEQLYLGTSVPPQ